MLKPALLYEDKLKEKLLETWYDDKYKFYNADCYNCPVELSKEDWQNVQLVSINSDDEVVAYINYSINRQTNNIESFGIMNFTNDNLMTFGKDLHQVVDDMFCKFHFNKLSFFVAIGNPIQRYYRKFVKKYGGRIVGYKEKDVKLIDNLLYDIELYEILADNYITNKIKLKTHKF